MTTIKHPLWTTLAGTALVATAELAPGVASASTAQGAPTPGTPAGARFAQAQQNLEHDLTVRVTQLGDLSGDVTHATSLTANDASVLAARLSTETTSINALVTSVPSDTTMAELRAARRTMIEGNRVFAVMTSQVFEVIEADEIAGEVATMESGEPALETAVGSLSVAPGSKNATSHYEGFVGSVGRAGVASAHVSTTVLDQIPQNFPKDTHVFVDANRQLLAADIDLAHASYDETVIGLASGGYTGS